MSTTNYLNLNKHDNVTTNQNAFDIENYLNGNWDKIDQNASSQSANLELLQSENTRLKKNQIYGTSTGTEVEITDSAEMGASIGVSGNSTQDEEPSPSNPSEIKNLTGNTVCKVIGKNRLDLSKCTLKNCILQENGTIKSDINNYYFCNATTTDLNKFILQHKGDTITFSIDTPIQNKTLTIVIYGTRASFSTHQEAASSKGSRSISVTIANDFTEITSLELRWNRDSSSFTDKTTVVSELMLCLGEDTDYEPRQEKTVTFPFGAQKLAKDDYLASDGIHNVRKQSTLPSIGNFISGTLFGEQCKFAAYELRDVLSQGRNYNFISDTIAPANDQYGKYKGYLNYKTLVVMTDTDDTLENFNSQISGSIVEYKLAEPTVTPYTQTQQEAYDKLQNLILFEGYNHIEMTSPNGVKAYLTVDYTKNTQMVINDIEERLSVLEYAGLEG